MKLLTLDQELLYAAENLRLPGVQFLEVSLCRSAAAIFSAFPSMSN